jgi:hypothetical protein
MSMFGIGLPEVILASFVAAVLIGSDLVPWALACAVDWWRRV